MSSRSKRNRNRQRTAGRPSDTGVSKQGEQGRGQTTEQQQHELLAMQTEYRGPLPPPDMLQQYEQIHPGMAERILQRFEQQAQHRQAIEHKVIDSQIVHEQEDHDEARRGQVFGFSIGVIGLIVAGAVATLGDTEAHAWAGAAIGGTTLVGLVTTFVVGRKIKQPAEDQEPSE